jgi:hypothetical protein
MDGRNAHQPDPSARGTNDPDCMLKTIARAFPQRLT